MANTSSAKKAIRSQKKKTTTNLRLRAAFREARKTLDSPEKLSMVYKQLDKAAKKHAIHPKTAARYKSRLTRKVNKPAKAK
jgi:ribosomal protein S20